MTLPSSPSLAPARVPDVPTRPVDYQQTLRGPRHRWWRPLASLVVVVACAVLLSIVIGLVTVVVGELTGEGEASADRLMNPSDPVGFLLTNLMLAALVPVAMFAVWLGHSVPGRWLLSVAGRFRWRWFARCLAVLAPLWAAYVALGLAVDGLPPSGRPAQATALLIIMILTTPVQCAGEELLFRGWVLQSLGSWCADRRVALAAPTVVSCALFAAAHGSADPWVAADLAIFAVAACAMTWRTGGLEAAIALHCVNNMLVMGVSLALGGFDEGFIDGTTQGSPLQLGPSLVMMSLAYALVSWQARRAQISRRTPQHGDAPRPMAS